MFKNTKSTKSNLGKALKVAKEIFKDVGG